MSTAIASRRKELAARILRIEHEQFLDRIDELLVRIEMQASVDASVAELERGEGIDLGTHRANAEAWIRAHATK